MLFIITNISVMACLHNQRHFIVTEKYRGLQVGEKCLIPILIGLFASLIFIRGEGSPLPESYKWISLVCYNTNFSLFLAYLRG